MSIEKMKKRSEDEQAVEGGTLTGNVVGRGENQRHEGLQNVSVEDGLLLLQLPGVETTTDGFASGRRLTVNNGGQDEQIADEREDEEGRSHHEEEELEEEECFVLGRR